MIEDAIVEADKMGTKVLALGALNKVRTCSEMLRKWSLPWFCCVIDILGHPTESISPSVLSFLREVQGLRGRLSGRKGSRDVSAFGCRVLYGSKIQNLHA